MWWKAISIYGPDLSCSLMPIPLGHLSVDYSSISCLFPHGFWLLKEPLQGEGSSLSWERSSKKMERRVEFIQFPFIRMWTGELKIFSSCVVQWVQWISINTPKLIRVQRLTEANIPQLGVVTSVKFPIYRIASPSWGVLLWLQRVVPPFHGCWTHAVFANVCW